MSAIGDFVTVQWAPSDEPTDLSPTWTEITSLVTEVDIRGGRSGVFELYGPRTATIRCRNGVRSPATAPTFALDGFYKWRQIQVTSTVGDLFTGYIVSLQHDQSDAPGVGWVTIDCVDELGPFARAEFNQTAGATVAGVEYSLQLTAAVTTAVANAATDATVTVTGGSTAYFKYPEPDEDSSVPTGNVLAWLQDVMESEFGTIQAPDGGHELQAFGRWYPFTVNASGTTASMTFSSAPGAGEYGFLARDLLFAATDTNYFTRAVTKNALSEKSHAADLGNGNLFTETFSRTSLAFIHDAWAEANAEMWQNLFSTSKAYPEELSIHMASPSTLESVATPVVAECALLGARFVTIKFTPAGSAVEKTYNCSVESFHHRITTNQWKTTLGFQSQDRWRTAYGNGTNTYALVQIGGVTATGISASNTIIAP